MYVNRSLLKFGFSQIHQFQDTIFALASGNIKAGVSIIRISGSDALQSYRMLLNQQSQRNALLVMNNETIKEQFHLKSRKAYFRKFYSLSENENVQEHDPIDAGIFLYFENPKSFTGEDILEIDVVELHIHGSKALQKKILLELSQINSFRLAQPGEFTKRAMLNNKLNLLEVEGLADLLNSETENQRIQSTQQFLGKSSQLLETWRWHLIRALARAEAFIDFESDQDDVDFNILGKTQENVKKVIQEIDQQINDSNRGEILRDGMKISIIGKPNSGKSTLLNCLAKRDIAIVSDIPGTTRDALSVSLNISGFPVILFDTAGIRQTNEIIEQLGVRKALEHARDSEINLWIIDGNDLKQDNQGKIVLEEGIDEINELISKNEKKTLIFINKVDSTPSFILESKQIWVNKTCYQIDGFISAKLNQNIETLISTLTQKISFRLNLSNGSIGSSVITQARHRIELIKCLDHLKIFSGNELNLPADMICEELRQAVNCIGRITGRVDIEEVLDVLFKEFCIGK